MDHDEAGMPMGGTATRPSRRAILGWAATLAAAGSVNGCATIENALTGDDSPEAEAEDRWERAQIYGPERLSGGDDGEQE